MNVPLGTQYLKAASALFTKLNDEVIHIRQKGIIDLRSLLSYVQILRTSRML